MKAMNRSTVVWTLGYVTSAQARDFGRITSRICLQLMMVYDSGGTPRCARRSKHSEVLALRWIYLDKSGHVGSWRLAGPFWLMKDKFIGWILYRNLPLASQQLSTIQIVRFVQLLSAF